MVTFWPLNDIVMITRWPGEAEPVMYSSPGIENEGVVALKKGLLAVWPLHDICH